MVRTRFQLGVELRADKPRMVLDLDDLDEAVVGQRSRDGKPRTLKLGTKIVVELVAVAMALTDFFLRVSGKALRAFPKLARISPQAHCTSLVLDVLLREHEVDDGMLRLVIEFRRMGVRHAADVTRKLDDGALHAEAQAEERNRVLTRVLHGANLALDAAVAKATRNEYSLAPCKDLAELDVRRLDCLRIDPGDLDVRIVRDARMVQRLRHRHVGVGQIHILADDGDLDFFRGMLDLEDHLLPLFHVRGTVIHVELFEHNLVEAFL
mgnify:CR=1 FL=1